MRPIYLVSGKDPSVLAQATRELVARLVGDRDPALVVEEHGGSASDELDVGAVIAACRTPPFLVDRRVVVVREATRLSAADGAKLAAALADPLPSTALVLVSGGSVPQALTKLVATSGTAVDASVRSPRDRARWVGEHIRQGPVRLESAAATRLERHLGEDVGRLEGLLDSLAAAYGEGAKVGVDELEPFLGDAGSVPSWDLTDALDRGDTAGALFTLHRMLGAGGLAPPVVLSNLHRHYAGLLRLDGAVRTADEAAQLLGTSSGFRAKKVLDQARALGSERIAQAITLVAGADVDTKGRSALPPELVLEVLVARLSRLVRVRATRRR